MAQAGGLNPYYKKARDESLVMQNDPDIGLMPDYSDRQAVDTGAGAPLPVADINQQPQQSVQDSAPSPSQPMTQDDFRNQLQQSFMQRAMAGNQKLGANQVTPADLAQQGQDARLRALATALTDASNKMGNVNGKYANNDAVAGMEKNLNAADQAQLAGKQQLYQQGNEDVAAGMHGISDIENQKYQEQARPLELEQKKLGLESQKLDFSNKQALSDPNSAESIYSRKFIKEAFGKDVGQDTTAMQLQTFLPLMEKKYQVDQNALTRRDMLSSKQDDRANKMSNDAVTKAQQALDPTKGRAGQFGEYQKKIDNADAVEKLITDTKGNLKNLDPRQMQELAISVNRMLGGSDSASQISHLVPHSMMGDASKVVEWLTNNPTGTDQKAFVQRMYETVGRERELAQQKVKDVQINRLKGFKNLSDDDRQMLMQQYGITDDDFKSGKAAPKGSSSTPTVAPHGSDLP